MIQCEKCQVWQHCDCVGQTGEEEESYLCPKCGDREAVLDIPLVPQPEYASPGEKYFISLSRGENLQVRVGDTVYVLRAFKNKNEDAGHSSIEGLLKISGTSAKSKSRKKLQETKKEKPDVLKENETEKISKEHKSDPGQLNDPTDNSESHTKKTNQEENTAGVSKIT
jgi:hypothetical protein